MRGTDCDGDTIFQHTPSRLLDFAPAILPVIRRHVERVRTEPCRELEGLARGHVILGHGVSGDHLAAYRLASEKIMRHL